MGYHRTHQGKGRSYPWLWKGSTSHHNLDSVGEGTINKLSLLSVVNARWRYPVLLSDSTNAFILQGLGFPYRYCQKDTQNIHWFKSF